MLASKHVRGPYGVTTLALCLVAIFETDERCLRARVLSIEVSMTPQPVQSLDVTGQQTVVERPDEVRDDVRVPARAG